MTAETKVCSGAPSARDDSEPVVDWNRCRSRVVRLQMRIAKATQEKRYGKVKALQWLLTHSYSGRMMAVKKVTSSHGKHTPGIDGIVWRTEKQRYEAARSLVRRGYQAQPLRRVKIPKSGGQRALGIPTMFDRAMQALHQMALEPVAEMTADKHSYGFRPRRSAHDALEQCFITLARRTSARWVLKADITSCFDTISHAWLMTHIPTDRRVLKQWLHAGYRERQRDYPTTAGTPQGGVISPTLANMTLDGLEELLEAAFHRREKVHVIRYADDIVVTGASKATLEQARTLIAEFLRVRGLALSAQKTRIVPIETGIDFLGFSLRKYGPTGRQFLSKPSSSSVKRLKRIVKETIRRSQAQPTTVLIKQLNPKLRGWANYYRHSVASRTYAAIDHAVFKQLWAWARRRHPNKGARWRQTRYFRRRGNRQWVFSDYKDKQQSASSCTDLYLVNSTRIVRHVKVRAEATPYDRAYRPYFERRRYAQRRRGYGASSSSGVR